MNIRDQLEHGWNLFFPREGSANLVETDPKYQISYEPHSLNPDSSIPLKTYSSSAFASMLFNRIAIDVSMIRFMHIKVDKDSDKQTVQKDSSLQRLFDVEANLDQTSTDFFHDLTYSLFDEGVVAVVITDATNDPSVTGMYEIGSLRVGKITQWYPTSVRVKLYNENTGQFSEVVVPKRSTAIIENPLNNIIGSGNPTLDRLLKKLSLLDKQDLDLVTNKLNVILQLPYSVKNEIKQSVAKNRVDSLEKQLKDTKLGVGYIGAEEKITQLTRPLNTSLMDEIKYLTDELLSQLGVTRKIFDGTASQDEMQNYYTRTIEPIAQRIQEEFQRKFITRTAYTQGHRIIMYQDPFRLVPTGQIATIMDTLIRNQILTSNEARSILGYAPSSNPLADELFNPNMPSQKQIMPGSPTSPEEYDPYMMDPSLQNGGEYQTEGQGYE